MRIKHQTRPKGFMLLEVLIAFAIFSISITSIVYAVHASTELNRTVEREKWVQKQLKNTLTEALKSPQNQEEFETKKDYTLDEFGAQAIVEITPSEILSENGTELRNLYDVVITIVWYDINGDKQTETLETSHYYPLYQY